jgi:hypothetical protein
MPLFERMPRDLRRSPIARRFKFFDRTVDRPIVRHIVRRRYILQMAIARLQLPDFAQRPGERFDPVFRKRVRGWGACAAPTTAGRAILRGNSARGRVNSATARIHPFPAIRTTSRRPRLRRVEIGLELGEQTPANQFVFQIGEREVQLGQRTLTLVQTSLVHTKSPRHAQRSLCDRFGGVG